MRTKRVQAFVRDGYAVAVVDELAEGGHGQRLPVCSTCDKVRKMTMMDGFRWWLFKKLSALGWWICPEPHKSNLQAATPSWTDYLRFTANARGTPSPPRAQ